MGLPVFMPPYTYFCFFSAGFKIYFDERQGPQRLATSISSRVELHGAMLENDYLRQGGGVEEWHNLPGTNTTSSHPHSSLRPRYRIRHSSSAR